MARTNLLLFETSAELCSVALAVEGMVLDEIREEIPRSHSRVLTALTQELFIRQNLGMNDLDAVAISSGPGSYTGLRIGVAAAKGIAWSLDIPLIAVPTTEAMVYGVSKNEKNLPEEVRHDPEARFCPLIDARRMEVYCGCYNKKSEVVTPVEAVVVEPSSFHEALEQGPVLFFGSGAQKCREVIHHRNAFFDVGFYPLAQHLIHGAWRRFAKGQYEDLAYFEPFYLKDFVPTTPKNKLMG